MNKRTLGITLQVVALVIAALGGVLFTLGFFLGPNTLARLMFGALSAGYVTMLHAGVQTVARDGW